MELQERLVELLISRRLHLMQQHTGTSQVVRTSAQGCALVTNPSLIVAWGIILPRPQECATTSQPGSKHMHSEVQALNC